MAAGITVPWDGLGTQTRELMNTGPLRAGEIPRNQYGTTAFDYGVHVPCHSGQSFAPPSYPAGSGQRHGAFYEKTGVLQHRTEPGFRDLKGQATLTEMPTENYGTLRRSDRLPGTATMILTASAKRASGYGSAPSSERFKPQVQGRRPGSGGGESRRSRASNASSRRSAGGQSQVSQASQASSVPSWAKRTAEAQRIQPWNFDQLPMYGRTNSTYGKMHTAQSMTMSSHMPSAGKSESGFLDPGQLIATLTRGEY